MLYYHEILFKNRTHLSLWSLNSQKICAQDGQVDAGWSHRQDRIASAATAHILSYTSTHVNIIYPAATALTATHLKQAAASEATSFYLCTRQQKTAALLTATAPSATAPTATSCTLMVPTSTTNIATSLTYITTFQNPLLPLPQLPVQHIKQNYQIVDRCVFKRISDEWYLKVFFQFALSLMMPILAYS